MSIWSNIGNFFTGLFGKAKTFAQKMWIVAKPLLQELLSATAQNAFSSLQALAVEAVGYVEAQGLPTSKDKQEAFYAYMLQKAKNQVEVLKESEINLLREIALAIFTKAKSQ